ncbi:hypothetical protein [Laspinema palackyanum]|uniref:hypothetical protein n=1 Tax=Laspinema palackyanum TaxID=3231601 RepID=UPI00345D7CD4|nr:hypothetical protein [Laspinema sp. D2c]
MAGITITIDGEDSESAAQDLLAIPGIAGTVLVEEGPKKTELLTTVASIVTIVGGTLTIAEQIRKWYQEAQQKRPSNLDVLLEGEDGNRVLLEDATVEEIVQILQSIR